MKNKDQKLKETYEQLKTDAQALRASEALFRTVVETAHEAIIVVNTRDTIVLWNSSAENIYKYSQEEILGKQARLLVPPQQRDLYLKTIAAHASSQMKNIREGFGLRKDGTEFPLEFSLSDFSIDNEILHTFIVRDISERKQVENDLRSLNAQLSIREHELKAREQELKAMNQELLAGTQQLIASEGALRQSEQQYRLLVETMTDGLVVRTPDGLFSYVNRAFCDMTGYSEDELLGRPVDDLLDEASRRFLHEELEKRKNGDVSRYEIIWRQKSGKEIITLVSPNVMHDEKGNFIGSFAVITDISDRKEAEKATSESKEFMEKIFTATADGIVVGDEQGKIVRINNAIEKILGFTETELVGRNTYDLFYHGDRQTERDAHLLKKIYETGSHDTREARWRRKDGSFFPVEYNVTFLKDEKGRLAGGVLAVRDITERKKMEQEMLRTEKLKSLGELAGGVAHDFNNMLTAILGRAQMLRKLVDAPDRTLERRKSIIELRKGLETIEKAALDGAETVRRVQEFSRGRDDERYREVVSLKSVMDGAVEFTKMRWKHEAEAKGITFTVSTDIPFGMPVVGNASELREVFTNFINNALDAMPHGGSLTIKAIREQDRIVISLQDTGTGISKEIVGNIFDPFFTTKGPQSTGLGLSVSYGILTRHQGTISVESAEGRGTTFFVTLPAGERSGRKKASRAPEVPLQRASILIIEDEQAVRNLLHDMLQHDGHEVTGAGNGSQGLMLFNGKKFDIVFTDLGMPGISGWQVAEAIKKSGRNIPVVLITGWEVEQEKEELKKRGIDFVISKPFRLEEISDVVRNAMELGKEAAGEILG